MRGRGTPRPYVLAGAIALDVLVGEPGNRWHPVARVGQLLEAGHRPLRGRRPAWQLLGGAAVLGAVALAAGTLGRLAERRLAWPLLAVALKPAFSIRQLLAAAESVRRPLAAGELEPARAALRALVSRPADNLSAPLIASAAIESLAENLADSITGPWFYYAAFGLPGALIYRVVNTADAMFGYRGDMEWLGKSAARADDLLNWIPSRLTALALVAAAGLLRGERAARRALHAWREEARTTVSPNAGRPMAAMAGGLGRRLEKGGHHVLGRNHPEPTAGDIRAASHLVLVGTAILALTTLVVLRAGRR